MNDDGLRIGDAERAAAAADLGEHFAQGRLTAEEHEERLTAIWTARTRADLTPSFVDLPSPYAATRAASAPTPARDGHDLRDARDARDGRERYWRSGLRPFRRGVPTPLVVILAVLVAITVVTHVPVVLIGLLVFWFVAHRHHPRRRHDWRY